MYIIKVFFYSGEARVKMLEILSSCELKKCDPNAWWEAAFPFLSKDGIVLDWPRTAQHNQLNITNWRNNK